MKAAYRVAILSLLFVQCLHAQVGDIFIDASGAVDVPLNARICAERIYANNPGYGTLTLADPGCLCARASIIPVELVSLSASCNEGTVMVRWRTASETDCAGFEVQRSSDRSAWQPVGFVPGQGTTAREHEYLFDDMLPSKMEYPRILYYRLRQIDHDGTFEYSPVVEAAIDASASTFAFRAIYPNPVSDRITLRYVLPDVDYAEVAVYSLKGEKVAAFEGKSMAGMGEHMFSVNASFLPPGGYLIELSAGGARLVRPVVVRR